MQLLRRTWADVSLDHLAHNYQVLRGHVAPGTKFLGVVKADAYGHGAVPISRHLADLGADYLAVSNLEEAMQLRQSEIVLPILILGYTPPQYAPMMAEQSITQEINTLMLAEQLSEAMRGTGKRLKVHLKLDTGMSRLGFFADGRAETIEQLAKVAALPGLEVEGVFTHFAVADSLAEEDIAYTKLQFSRFMDTISHLKACGVHPQLRHCANSGASILYPEYALDMIRPGIATYGHSPAPELAGKLDLRPIMQFCTTIVQCKDFASDVCISYGRTFRTSRPMRVAVLPVGYADGLPRRFSNAICFTLHGRRVPVIGRICMDMCMVDVTEVPEAAIGDTVCIFGDGTDGGNTCDALAVQAETISYELLCAVSKRVPRLYWQNGKQLEILQYLV